MYWTNDDWMDANILTVTTLADSGAGSLRAALSASGKRVIVFAVSGLITVRSELDIDYPRCWECGYTAGEFGVVLVGDGSTESIINVNTSDVILQGLTILCNNSGEGTRSVSVAERGKNPKRILLQNLATGVSEDENVIIWYDTQYVTYRDSISAFSLLPGGKGPNLGSEGGGNYLVERNIFYGHRQRLPRTKADSGPIFLVNNLAMNHQGSGASVRNSDGCELHAYGNIDWQKEDSADYYISTDSDSSVYHDGNWIIRGDDVYKTNIVKSNRGTQKKAGYGYIENLVHLMEELIKVSGNSTYLDNDYVRRHRQDPFTRYVSSLVMNGEFLEVKSSYAELDDWTRLSPTALVSNWTMERLIKVALRLQRPDPDPDPDPRPDPDPDPDPEPIPDAIEKRLVSIETKLGEVVDFIRSLRDAMK